MMLMSHCPDYRDKTNYMHINAAPNSKMSCCYSTSNLNGANQKLAALLHVSKFYCR